MNNVNIPLITEISLDEFCDRKFNEHFLRNKQEADNYNLFKQKVKQQKQYVPLDNDKNKNKYLEAKPSPRYKNYKNDGYNQNNRYNRNNYKK
jgi:hypothetical protein